MTTKRELIGAWIAALESGAYKQADGTLRTTRKEGAKTAKHCCLGVVCEVATSLGITGVTISQVRKDTNDELLPKALAKRLNMTINGSFQKPVRVGTKAYDSLVDMNDSGIDFKTIAKTIRQQLRAKNFKPFSG